MNIERLVGPIGIEKIKNLKGPRNYLYIEADKIIDVALQSFSQKRKSSSNTALFNEKSEDLESLRQLLLSSLCFLQTDDSKLIDLEKFIEYTLLLPTQTDTCRILKRTLFQTFHVSALRLAQVSSNLMLAISDRLLLAEARTDFIRIFDINGQPIDRLCLKTMVNRFATVNKAHRIVGKSREVLNCQALSWCVIQNNELAISTSSYSIVFLNSVNYDIKDVLNVQRRIHHMKLVESLSYECLLCWAEHNRGEVLIVDLRRRILLNFFFPHGELCHFLSVVSLSEPPSCDSDTAYMATVSTLKKVKLWNISIVTGPTIEKSDKIEDSDRHFFNFENCCIMAHCHTTIDTGDVTIDNLLFMKRHGLLIGVGYDTKVFIWNSLTGQLISRLSGHNSRIISASKVCDDSIITCEEKGTFILWNITDVTSDEQHCLQIFSLDLTNVESDAAKDVTFCQMTMLDNRQMLLGLRGKSLFAYDCHDLLAPSSVTENIVTPLLVSLSLQSGTLMIVYSKALFIFDAHSCQVLQKHDIASYHAVRAESDSYHRLVTIVSKTGVIWILNCGGGIVFRSLGRLSSNLLFCTAFYPLLEMPQFSSEVMQLTFLDIEDLDSGLLMAVQSNGTILIYDTLPTVSASRSSTDTHLGKLVSCHETAHDFSQKRVGIDVVVAVFDLASRTVLLCDGIIISSWHIVSLTLHAVYFGLHELIIQLRQAQHGGTNFIIGLCKNGDLGIWREFCHLPWGIYKQNTHAAKLICMDVEINSSRHPCGHLVLGWSDGFVSIASLDCLFDAEVDHTKGIPVNAKQDTVVGDLRRLRQLGNYRVAPGPLGGQRRESEECNSLKQLVAAARQYSTSFLQDQVKDDHMVGLLPIDLDKLTRSRWQAAMNPIAAVKFLNTDKESNIVAVTPVSGEVSFWSPFVAHKVGQLDAQNINSAHCDFSLAQNIFEDSLLCRSTVCMICEAERKISTKSQILINIGSELPISVAMTVVKRAKKVVPVTINTESVNTESLSSLARSPSSKKSLQIWEQLASSEEELAPNLSDSKLPHQSIKTKQLMRSQSLALSKHKVERPNTAENVAGRSDKKSQSKAKVNLSFGMYGLNEVLAVRKLLAEFIDPKSAVFNLTAGRDWSNQPHFEVGLHGSCRFAIDATKRQLDVLIVNHSSSLANRAEIMPYYTLDGSFKTESPGASGLITKDSCPLSDLVSVFFPGISPHASCHIWQFSVALDHFDRLAIVLDILLDSLKTVVRSGLREIMRSNLNSSNKPTTIRSKFADKLQRKLSAPANLPSKSKVSQSFQDSLTTAGGKETEEFFSELPRLWEITLAPHIRIMVDSLFQTLLHEAPSNWEKNGSYLAAIDFGEAIRETSFIPAVIALINFYRNHSLVRFRSGGSQSKLLRLSSNELKGSSEEKKEQSALQQSMKKTEGIMRLFSLNGVSPTTTLTKEMANRLITDLTNDLWRDTMIIT